MKCSIIYSTKTGNTAMLAQRILGCLPEDTVICSGTPTAEALDAEVICAGFWTDKGNCDETAAAWLPLMKEKKVFLFGTAGFGTSEDYFKAILSRVEQKLDSSNVLLGSFMCQGKMPGAVRQRYEAMAVGAPEKAAMMLDNFDKALTHPNSSDLDRLEHEIRNAIR